ncbi:MAG: hypothetical protein B7Z33_00755 [Sphingomonadales bacterium 12-68-11]|nr:MAG: hypothetical protein B7Z33_00755 [Sphingomonadales bacterium 12-68-11]OYX16955.1 MAG: hypothetical protein B7Z07_01510 [Sphingomonadales bacterium 32-67-7]
MLAALVLAGCATNVNVQGRRLNLEGPPGREREGILRADPSKVVAAELAFARLAQEKGQWTAFAQTATDNAVMFVPQPVVARQWLRRQANPAQAVKWQPHQVWSSCDGSMAVTKGAWQRPDGSVGYFTTVWERQRRGEYKWVMDQGDTLAQPLAAPEMIAASAADCGGQPTPPADLLAGPEDQIRAGTARDGTLRWQVVVKPDGSRRVIVRRWDGSAWRDALDEQVAAG